MRNILLLIGIITVCSMSCREKEENPFAPVTVNGMVTIAVPKDLRDIGYDSIELLSVNGELEPNFCFPNNLRFKKDTIYSEDTLYRLWGWKVQIAPGTFIVKKDISTMKLMNGIYQDGIMDSVIIDDSIKIIIKKLK